MQETGRVPALSNDRRRKRVNRFLLMVGWIFFLGLFLLLFMRSPLSKIDTINVTGNEILDPSTLVQLSAINKGDSFFTLHTSMIEGSIQALPEVKGVRIIRDFPGKVTIEIEEYKRVAYKISDNDQIIPILETGRLLENRPWNDRFIDRPLLRHWQDHELLAKLSAELLKLIMR